MGGNKNEDKKEGGGGKEEKKRDADTEGADKVKRSAIYEEFWERREETGGVRPRK